MSCKEKEKHSLINLFPGTLALFQLARELCVENIFIFQSESTWPNAQVMLQGSWHT